MEIGILASTFEDLPLRFDLDVLAQSGFSCIDYQEFSSDQSPVFSMTDEDFVTYLTHIRAECASRGVQIHQLHSLWVSNMFEFDVPERLFSSTIRYYIKAIEGARILGCPYVVLHHRLPFPGDTLPQKNDEARKINIEFLRALLPYAHQNGVCLCLENLPFPWPYTQFEDTLRQVEEIGDDHLGMCLDTGHFNMYSNGYTIEEAVKRMGKKLFVLHCHDNKGDRDSHNFPGQGTLDWQGLKRGLKEISFPGVFSFETRSKAPQRETQIKENHDLFLFGNRLMNEMP